jgi:hypothetical protein
MKKFLKGIIVFLLNIIFLPITAILSLIALFEVLGGGQGEIIWKWLSLINLSK